MRIGLLLLFVLPVFGAIEPHSIPRQSTHRFQSEGLFEGGTTNKANIETIQIQEHLKGFERWVIHFSDEKKKSGQAAPQFQIRYIKAEKIPLPDGSELMKKPARFVFVFRQIQKNHVHRSQIKGLLKKSRFVRDIVLYPPIEDGDTAMEFVLNDNVLFETHQPLNREGQIVLDLARNRTVVTN